MLKSERDKPVWVKDVTLQPFQVSKRKSLEGYLRKAQKRRYHTHRTHFGSVWLENGTQLDISGWEGVDSGGKWYIKLKIEQVP